jgi:hypothetical protein
MKKVSIGLFGITFVLLTASALFSQAWIDLFDGQSLDGWSVHSGYATYHVKDGVIVGTTAKGSSNTFLCTDKEYGDFILEFDVMCDPELNSGVQFRSIIAQEEVQFILRNGNGQPHVQKNPPDRLYGYQVEIATEKNGTSGGVYDEARRAFFLDDVRGDAKASNAFKDGQWNNYRIKCQGNHIQTWVNDVPCADFRDDMTDKGVIGLQVHGIGDSDETFQVMWRNIRIQELLAE